MDYTKMTLERRVAQKLFAEARRRKIKLRRLAEVTDIEPMRMYHLNALSGLIRLEELVRICAVLGLSMDKVVAEAREERS